MPLPKDERNRILSMIETGQINALEASQLLDALEIEQPQPVERKRERTLRIRGTAIHTKQKQSFSASMPLQLLRLDMHLGGYILPQLNQQALSEIIQVAEESKAGRLLDFQDLEHGERIEIFVE